MSFGGPTLEARSYTKQNITFVSSLGVHPLAQYISQSVHGTQLTDPTSPRATVHMHGAVVEPVYDGHPEDTFRPGARKVYKYSFAQEACHLWYHDHSLGMTRLNVYGGLAGHTLVRDDFDSGVNNKLGLPSGNHEIPLTLQDRSVDLVTGQLSYFVTVAGEGNNLWWPGTLGQLSLVNGEAFPKLAVERGVYRFRILNGANTRFYRMHMTGRKKFYVIGNDQGLLNAPVATDELFILPGERYDVLIDFSNEPAGSSIVIYNTDIPTELGFVLGHFLEVMRFDVVRTVGKFRSIPAKLRGNVGQPAALPPAASYRPVRTRTITMAQVEDDTCGNKIPIIGALQMRMNNMRYDQAVTESVPTGQWELWNVVNVTADYHPFHVHYSLLRILNRQTMNVKAYLAANPIPPTPSYWAPSPDAYLTGSPTAPEPWEAGRKNTVAIAANSVTRILVWIPPYSESRLDPTASFTNAAGETLSGYMYHCHILEHEDCDMMRPMLITT